MAKDKQLPALLTIQHPAVAFNTCDKTIRRRISNGSLLASKAAFRAGLDAILSGKSLGDGGAMVQAIHDASAHLGAECAADYGFADDDLSEGGDDGADDGANKAAALQIRLKALSR